MKIYKKIMSTVVMEGYNSMAQSEKITHLLGITALY